MKTGKQNTPAKNKLKFKIENNEIDLCADIDQQPLNFANYVASINGYCVNCKNQPCMCHLINTI